MQYMAFSISSGPTTVYPKSPHRRGRTVGSYFVPAMWRSSGALGPARRTRRDGRPCSAPLLREGRSRDINDRSRGARSGYPCDPIRMITARESGWGIHASTSPRDWFPSGPHVIRTAYWMQAAGASPIIAPLADQALTTSTVDNPTAHPMIDNKSHVAARRRYEKS